MLQLTYKQITNKKKMNEGTIMPEELKKELLSIIINGAHKCDFGCDNGCDQEGMLPEGYVGDLIIAINHGGEEND